MFNQTGNGNLLFFTIDWPLSKEKALFVRTDEESCKCFVNVNVNRKEQKLGRHFSTI
jgi:hypothetical protein